MTTIVWWRGVRLDERTRAQMVETERIVKHHTDPVQGSYSDGANSAGTHSGGGAIDLSTSGLTADQKYRLVKAMRIVGFAAWLRPYRPGVWREHIHAVSVGCPDLDPAAVRQVIELRNGGDGLAGSAPDPHRNMGVPVRTWEQYVAARDGLTRIAARPRYKQKGEHVKAYQYRLRAFVAKYRGWGKVGQLNPGGATGYYGWETRRLQAEVHGILAGLTSNAGWKSLTTEYPGDSLLARLGLTVR